MEYYLHLCNASTLYQGHEGKGLTTMTMHKLYISFGLVEAIHEFISHTMYLKISDFVNVTSATAEGNTSLCIGEQQQQQPHHIIPPQVLPSLLSYTMSTDGFMGVEAIHVNQSSSSNNNNNSTANVEEFKFESKYSGITSINHPDPSFSNSLEYVVG
eukprot:5039237-Ditylum_brightwellii.AAC.1